MLQRLQKCLIVIAAAVAFATPAAAKPALWVVKDADSTIYLFGTVHLLKPGLDWRSPRLDSALAESPELVVEVLGMDDPAAIMPLIQAHGLDPARPLSTKLAPKDRPRLAAAAKLLGLPPQGLEVMKPWLAALTLTVAPIQKAGYDPQSGVELIFLREAKAAGRKVESLETGEQQIRFFADMPEARQTEFLSATLDDVDDAAAQLDTMVAAWQAGDLAAFETIMIAEMRQGYPGLYEVLLASRNRAWADHIKAKLAGSGVSFMAVGAGHLAGPDSVQAELAKRGIAVERLQ